MIDSFDFTQLALIIDFREKQGKKAQPTVAIIDSQSSKNSSMCSENVGIDGGKLIKEGNGFILLILWEIYLTVLLFPQIATMEQR